MAGYSLLSSIWSTLNAKTISALANALLWIMYKNGVKSGIHYLDEFLFCGAPGSDDRECAGNLVKALEMCSELGVPVACQKLERQTTSLKFLGIVIDTNRGQLHLPSEKTRLLTKVSSSMDAAQRGSFYPSLDL